MNRRLLLLTRYGPLGASSRVRAYQFVPRLTADGFEVTAAPLLTDEYLRRLYGRQPISKGWLLRAYAHRLAEIVRARHFDLVWIEKEALPWLPGWLERLLLAGTRYVLDYDDAIFHTYDLHPNPIVRKVLGMRVDRVMRGSALVLAGNEYLAARARQAGAARVELLPSVIDLSRYEPAPSRPAGAPFTIGWIGSPGSERLLGSLRDVLGEVTRDGTRLRLIGAEGRSLDGVRFESRPWHEETETEEIRRFDVGIMPLSDEPWTRGKCGFKLIQYMGCAVPVVASPVGVNTEIVTPGWNGFLADSPEAWKAAFHTLREDPALARQMGGRGRERVAKRYSLAVAAPRLSALLRSVIE